MTFAKRVGVGGSGLVFNSRMAGQALLRAALALSVALIGADVLCEKKQGDVRVSVHSSAFTRACMPA